MSGLSDSSITLTKPVRPDGSNLLELLARIDSRLASLRALETVQSVTGNGSILIDASLGEYVRLSLSGDVTKVVISNWMNPSIVTRLTLEIINPGGHTLNLGFAQWLGGAPKVLKGTILLEVISPDSGRTVFGRAFQDRSDDSLMSMVAPVPSRSMNISTGSPDVGRPVLTVHA